MVNDKKKIAFNVNELPQKYEIPNGFFEQYDNPLIRPKSHKFIALANAIEYIPNIIENILDQELNKFNSNLGIPIWEISDNLRLHIGREIKKPINNFYVGTLSTYWSEEGKRFGYGHAMLQDFLIALNENSNDFSIHISRDRDEKYAHIQTDFREEGIQIKLIDYNDELRKKIFQKVHSQIPFLNPNAEGFGKLNENQTKRYFNLLFKALSEY